MGIAMIRFPLRARMTGLARSVAVGCIAALGLVFTGTANAQVDNAEMEARTYDMALGSPTAPVTVVEYASVGCPVCGRWDTDVFPAFQDRYINSGKVRFVFRELLVGAPQEVHVGEAGFLLARCVGKDNYFTVADAIFRILPDIYRTWDDPHAADSTLLKIAQAMGLTEAEYDHCVTDQAALQALRTRVEVFERYEHLNAAPTFVVNGVPLRPGYQSLSDLDAAIGQALGIPVPPVHATARSTGPHSLVMRAVDDSGPADPGTRPPTRGDERAHQVDGGDLWLRPGVVIASDMFKEAEVSADFMNRRKIGFRFTEEGSRHFAAFTRANVGGRFAIVWGGVVLSAPRIMMPITGGSGEITGDISAEEAAGIVRSIKSRRPHTSSITH